MVGMIRLLACSVAVATLTLTSCRTATHAKIDSIPGGARLYVQGNDTGLVTPAELDVERFAFDPDLPMPIELRLAGHVSTWIPPYPRRHQCSQLVCSKKQRHSLPITVRMFEEGTGIRVDTTRPGYEVAVDDGPWLLADAPASIPGAAEGVTLLVPPGEYELHWRYADVEKRRSHGPGTALVTVPAVGFIAVHLHRWPWGIPLMRKPRTTPTGTP